MIWSSLSKKINTVRKRINAAYDRLSKSIRVTVHLLLEAMKVWATVAALVATQHAGVNESSYERAATILSQHYQSNLNYVVLRYLDAETVSVLWNLTIVWTAVLCPLLGKPSAVGAKRTGDCVAPSWRIDESV
ncbi:hypothetical protein PsorP6_011501 [Peronosclerospora sorghi]|uniref:Uncharacterized protein n=1 Tax=Peronosclerospora sorghi TaxID=230839 RepID=A0ACC0WI79_9STRA|nr:hypothetical protein PsorP6_011501 [Peronosclerospora sorghi]